MFFFFVINLFKLSGGVQRPLLHDVVLLHEHAWHTRYSGRKSIVPMEQNHDVKKGALYST